MKRCITDCDRYSEYLAGLATGETKVNAATLFPYDIIEKYISRFGYHHIVEDTLIEEQWKALPNYVEDGMNAIVMADTSGSMTCNNSRPLFSALGLALYFANRNVGAYHGLWMSFSMNPKIHHIKGSTLAKQIQNIDMSRWAYDTNLEAAFMKVLDIALKNNVPREEMVKSIIVISDMEINECVSSKWSFYDEMKNRFERHGYDIPNVVFWNVNSRNDIFHADYNRKGVQLCSGQSASTFKTLVASIGLNPYQTMLKTLNSDRYACISVA